MGLGYSWGYSWLKGTCQGRCADGLPSQFDFYTLLVHIRTLVHAHFAPGLKELGPFNPYGVDNPDKTCAMGKGGMVRIKEIIM